MRENKIILFLIALDLSFTPYCNYLHFKKFIQRTNKAKGVLSMQNERSFKKLSSSRIAFWEKL